MAHVEMLRYVISTVVGRHTVIVSKQVSKQSILFPLQIEINNESVQLKLIILLWLCFENIKCWCTAHVCSGSIVVTTLDSGPGGPGFES